MMMIVLKYLVFSLFIVVSCRELNFKNITAKINKRKSFVPRTLPKPVKTIKPRLPLLTLRNNLDDSKPLNGADPEAKIHKRKGFIPRTRLKLMQAIMPDLPLLLLMKNITDNSKPLNGEDPQIKILDSNGFPTTTKLTAALVLRQSLNMFPSNPCEILKGVFQRIYDEYAWHCVEYNMVAVTDTKFINLEVNNKKYLLFATNK